MLTHHKDYGCTAKISDMKNGKAKLMIYDPLGKLVHNKIHANRKAAYSAWRRFCN